MPLPVESAFAASLKSELAALDPDGFGSLSAEDQARIEAKLFTAIATVTLDAIKAGTVSVNGTTASACAAGGAAGTCTASGSIT